ncbi:glycoside hydrolase family 140 protein [Desertivirga xinjiangensis]|uniref:glycoside hydrolase family 140 protein n=1 Tax=Desertivirga xinjiangensis TaxID=539206 RepID=UPI00210D347D|nr:glycoside hydrolase family 140 protein [Pedobacter xinjiangensis]
MKKSIFLSLLCFSIHSSILSQDLDVSLNKRFLLYKNKPFAWIGDTAWELFHVLNREEADRYLEKRAKQGFTVIQAVILAESDGLRKPNAYGELPFLNLSPDEPNDLYFRHVDYIINKAEKLGLVMAILPTWADKVPSDREGWGPVIFNKQNAEHYGNYLGRRYLNKPVVWVLGGDRNILNEETFQIWKAMGLALKNQSKGSQLITYHPAGESSSSKWFQNEAWLDFNMYQSGHAKRFMPVYKYAETDYSVYPPKPFIDAEPAYEDIPVEFWKYLNFKNPITVPVSILNKDNILINKGYFKKGFFSDYDVRLTAYWNFLSGACGYTYGNNAVWQMFRKKGTFVIPCLTDWKKALKRPGAKDIKHLKALLIEKGFSKLVPDQSLILGVNRQDSTHIRAARAEDNSFAIIYLALGQPVDLNLSTFKGQLTAYWYNPRNGRKNKIKNSQEKNGHFTPPSSGIDNDWVLILECKPHY